MNNNKQSLYTKYRPQTFDQVVGQKVAKEILINSISKNKINHAYLFFGIRGTGKTTLARIFAKAINCHQRDENNNPCNQCDTCKSINNGSALDIIEIDAASNNGVDEIRYIKENTSYLTTQSTYKVYIIDEVHMLTKAAFNALLKTLEEPPRNTVFILATTELQKIPQTVLSRTVILNLEVMSEEDIKEGLRVVIKGENVNYEEEALDYLEMVASGSLRDGISALETTLLYNDELSVNNVISALGLIRKGDIASLLINNKDELVNIIDSTDKDPAKLAILIMEVIVNMLKEGKYEYAILLNNLVKVSNTIKDPLLLKIALKSAILGHNVSQETIRVEKSNVSRETNYNEEIVDNVENNEIEVEKSEENNISGKLSNEEEPIDTLINEEKTPDISIHSEEVIHNIEEEPNKVEIVENLPKNEEIKIDKSSFNVITDFIDANNYLYIMLNNDDLEFSKAKNRWRYIDNYLVSVDYKDIVAALIKTQPLAATEKSVIVGFHSEKQLNDFKRLSLEPAMHQFIKEIISDYKFILPVNNETWTKLMTIRKNYVPNDKFKDVPLKVEDFLENTAEIKKQQLDDLFGKENVVHE